MIREDYTNKKNNYEFPNKVTVPVTYPDTRYPKTRTPKPSEDNVIYSKKWVEFDRL